MDHAIKLRAHHIFCLPLSKLEFPERGSRFSDIHTKVRQAMRLGTDECIEIIEGIDELCLSCPSCTSSRCESPEGNEEKVRKWDALLLSSLDLSMGSTLSGQRIREIVRQKFPAPLCNRCQWRDSCQTISESNSQ
ncbi:DUF1284 domain-containing protein [Chloroflexota bacterium]